MIAEKPASLEFPLLAVCGITLGSVDRGEMHVSCPYLADNCEVKRLLCVYLDSSIVAIVLAGRRFSEWGGEA